jgi:hypothetical protein
MDEIKKILKNNKFVDISKYNKINKFIEYETNFDISGIRKKDVNINMNDCRVTHMREFIYIIFSKNNMYASIGITHNDLWYKYELNKNGTLLLVNEICKYYFTEEKILDKEEKGFVGTCESLHIKQKTFEKELINHSYVTQLCWGSMWEMHPFMDMDIKNVDEHDIYFINAYSMKQKKEEYKISIITKYSRSIISYEIINDIIGITIKYQEQCKLDYELLDRYYNKKLPPDVIEILLRYPFLKYDNLFK